MPLIEKRYAEALINLASQEDEVELYLSDLSVVTEAYEGNLDFKNFIINPQLSKDLKRQTVKRLFEDVIKKEVLSFIMLLINKERISLLVGIFSEYVKLRDKRNKVLNLKVISSSELSINQIDEIKNKYMRLYNAPSAKVESIVDSSLIGGIKVQIGDKVIDATIKSRLDGLRLELMKN